MLRIFGFGRKPSPPPEAQAPPQVNPPQQAKTPPRINVRPSPSPPGQHTFQVKTRISKAVGKEGRYACHSVRALPSVHKGEVILQATDGHQATCVLTPGQMASSRLVPASVLPSRQVTNPVGIRLIGGKWESMEGRTAEDKSDSGSFPTMGDVLPVVGTHPFYETTAQSQGRRTHDPAPSMMVTLGIDIDLLRKAAEALGTSKLTLFIPVPIKDNNQKSSDVFVNKPVAICPAVRSEANGVSVVMPLTPEHGTAYYTKVREVIAASEKLAAKQAKPLIAKPARQAG